ncbi:unnamed protein product, partial [Rotaria sp. Silwood2]
TTTNMITYSANFTTSTVPTSQCTQWESFVAQLTVRTYTLLIIQGTYDTVGLTLNDSTIISNIAEALRTSSSYGPITSNGVSWAVGICVSGVELSAHVSICVCSDLGYTVRPCVGVESFGGINTNTCSGPTQSMTVIFQY